MAEKVLVTGAAGFIGSHLVEELVHQGYEVRAFVRYNSRGSWGWLEDLPSLEGIEVYQGDIRDYDRVKGAVRGVDLVFHLAALIGIPYSYLSPLAYIKTNIEGTYNVLQAALEEGVKKVLHISTSEVYGTAQYVPIDEHHPLQAQSPYAASKIAADHLAMSYYRSFGLPVAVARPFNTFGPRQSVRAVIPTIITQALAGDGAVRLGNLSPTRDFNYVKDTVLGMIAVASCEGAVGKVVNLGSGREISIRDLVRLIEDLTGKKLRIEGEEVRVRPEKSEVERLLCNNCLAQELVGWKPRYTLEEGLRETIDWFKGHLRLFKTGLYGV